VVGDAQGLLRVFELGAKRAALELGISDGAAGHIAFSPDGTRLAAAGGTVIRVWDTEGKPLFVFRGHLGNVSDLAFAPDGRTLVSTSEDGTALVWDVVTPPAREAGPGTAVRWDRCWHDLAEEDADRAFQAIAALRARPVEAVTLLKERLKVVPPLDPKRVQRLLTDLESEEFATRRQAIRELEGLDVQVEEALRTALGRKPGLHAQRGLRSLLAKLEGPVQNPDRLREVRAVEALEQMGNQEARLLLQTLARGADARLTREAREALKRLNGRAQAP
jgi:hypothetical protein